jgi:hypothetical protein
MTPFQSACVVIFGILAYLMWVDENVAIYLTLIFKIMRVNIERMLWMIRFHPRNPITNLMMKWKYDRLARELQAEMECKATEATELNNAGKVD